MGNREYYLLFWTETSVGSLEGRERHEHVLLTLYSLSPISVHRSLTTLQDTKKEDERYSGQIVLVSTSNPHRHFILLTVVYETSYKGLNVLNVQESLPLPPGEKLFGNEHKGS